MGKSKKEKKEMNCIDVKKTTTTQMKIKKATVSDGTFYVDGEAKDLPQLLSDTFGDCVFEVSITEKTVETEEE